MADSSVLREFLVSLGYKVDTSSEAKFKDSVKAASDQIKTFGTALAGAATVVNIGIMRMANDLNDLYLASGRTKASADNIKTTMEYAVGQLGGTAEGARGSLEALAANLRNRPGYYNMLEDLGVKTKDANGNLRDSVDLLADLGDALKDKPYYQQNAYASSLGIDERTLMAITKPEFRAQMQAYREMLKAAGVDQGEAAEKANEFSRKSSELWAGVKVAMAGVTGVITQDLIPVLDVANSALKSMLEWFRDLDPGTKNVAKNVGEIGLVFGTILATIKSATIAMGLLKSAAGLASGGAAAGAAGGAGAAAGAGAAGAAAAKSGLLKKAGVVGLAVDAVTGVGDLKSGKRQTEMSGFDYLSPMRWGMYAGEKINGILSTETKDVIGGAVATAFARFGDKEAQHALDVNLGGIPDVTPASKPKQPTQPYPPVTNAYPSDDEIWKKRGIRNNNPGNIDFSGMSQRYFGATKELDGPKSKGRFAVFKDADTGLQALAVQLKRYANAGINTVQGIIGKYAPPNENKTQLYIESVAKRLGVKKDSALNLTDKTALMAMMEAVIIKENGKNPYAKEQLSRAAELGVQHNGRWQGGWGASPTINQTNTVTINGVQNPREAADAVSSAQRDVNAELARNMRTSAR
ncbi:hypothetical protein JOS77_29155 [Chromobacterium haemolyticum]|nr:hypothetical protein JOS77_29155 [Chromobacterium haemolyticum]